MHPLNSDLSWGGSDGVLCLVSEGVTGVSDISVSSGDPLVRYFRDATCDAVGSRGTP